MATNQQNINIGTADNANDGDTLRAAFRKVRKMFAEIYGDTDAENLGDTETVPATSFDTHITEKIEDTVATMFSDGTHSNITVTYDDSDGTLDLEVAADIESIATAANSGLSGGVVEGDATLTLDLNNLSADVVDVSADSIAIVDASDSNNTKKESIADLMAAVAGNGISPTNGVLNVSVSGNEIQNNTIDGSKLDQFDDSLTAATGGHILVSNGTDFIHKEMTGVIDISSAGVTSFDSAVDGDGITNTSGVLSLDVDDSTVEVDATNGLQLKDNGVTHDKLENRYTARLISASTGSQNLNCANASSFKLTGNIAASTTLTLQNMKIGQSVDILFTGTLTSATGLTLDTNFTTDTIYRVGDGEFDTSTGNLIQVTCLDDDDNDAIIAYSVVQFTTDNTP